MASAQGGAHLTARAESPQDAVIYLESLPAEASPARPAERRPGVNDKAAARDKPNAKQDGPRPAEAKTAIAKTGSKPDAHANVGAKTEKIANATRDANRRTASKPGANGKETGAAKASANAKTAMTAKTAKTAAVPKRADLAAGRADVATIDATSRAVIGQVEHRFVPRVLPVALGTTVLFENRDRVWHNAFSISPAKRFDLGKYPPRQARAVTFDAPGVVQLYSDIDPSMAGFVFVSPTPIFTQPDPGGAFALPALPAGTYTLKVWHPTLGRLTRRVEVTGQADPTLSLTF
jgi:plastocyanin